MSDRSNRDSKRVIVFSVLTVVSVALTALISYSVMEQVADAKKQDIAFNKVTYQQPTHDPFAIELEEPAPPEPKQLKIAAVGDIMVHIEQINAARENVDGKQVYDFGFMFDEIAPFLKQADFVIGNLETTIAGEGKRGYSGYPEFNSPESLLAAIRNAGFDYVSTANNHSLDRREAGVIATIDNLEANGLLYSGTARNQQERDYPTIVERNGIQLGLLSYTYGTNGIPVPEGKDYLVNLIDKEQMKQDIANIRDQVDFVIVSMHYGHEYHRKPNQEQIAISDFLVDNGADIVLGSHPHVLQPATWKERQQMNPRTGEIENRDAFIIYSMGNFVSAQRGDYKDNGAIIYLTLTIGSDQKANIEQASFLPTYVQKFWHEGKSKYRVLAAEKSISDYKQQKDPLLREFDYNKLQQAMRDTRDHLMITDDQKKAFSLWQNE